jgi:hypothetical protein
LPLLEATTLATHALPAIATGILFLFQIAKLEASISARLGNMFLETAYRKVLTYE